MEKFLWEFLPYIIFTIFIGGHIYRYQTDQFGWTSKSSELLEKKQLKWGSTLFHFGIVFAFLGHVMGILIPAGVYESMGISEHLYHLIALIGGIPAGIATVLGLVILTWRRLTVKRILRTSTKSDIISLIFLVIVAMTGLTSTFLNIDPNGFDYRTTLGEWFRGLFLFQANANHMLTVPLWFKIHVLSALGLIAVWPFTRLVHVFSLPLRYLNRSYVVYRRRKA